MTPEERLKRNAKALIQQGCSPTDAVIQAAKEFGNLADRADVLQAIKLQLQREMRSR